MAAACSNSCITAALHVWGRGNRTGMQDVLGSFRKGLELGTFVDKWNLEPKSYESNETPDAHIRISSLLKYGTNMSARNPGPQLACRKKLKNGLILGSRLMKSTIARALPKLKKTLLKSQQNNAKLETK